MGAWRRRCTHGAGRDRRARRCASLSSLSRSHAAVCAHCTSHPTSPHKPTFGTPRKIGQGCRFHSFTTNTYKMHFLESPSGIKVCFFCVSFWAALCCLSLFPRQSALHFLPRVLRAEERRQAHPSSSIDSTAKKQTFKKTLKDGAQHVARRRRPARRHGLGLRRHLRRVSFGAEVLCGCLFIFSSVFVFGLGSSHTGSSHTLTLQNKNETKKVRRQKPAVPASGARRPARRRRVRVS